ncbi:asparagine synthase (glutamine-hydrolyzing) [Kitasatospora aureofaciens]|uniref:asparagine synthase (glutamine-hydrolyzing) n=1 Tax=Kitasatospora aureofaciens TaxID=1894 RepID=UPI001C47923D|nr:asparagine synthase (glutamine-hydrolyzing) [Kitasatospora aureofaciens]MBV6696682.1 asparagine synthase (glutamine-hydrolyzing) [Kitasatospora aureofaciens]
MCGIAGWVDFGQDALTVQTVVRAMTDSLACRGPDGDGVWFAPHAGFGHTRNAVIDIPGGGQPMAVEENGRAVVAVTYNGEIYNFRELRAELESRGHRFRTRCDTEVVIRGYLEWGADCGRHFNGMFAFGIWDSGREELLLIRDQMGIKPLLYKLLPDGIVFGSEAKALLAHPAVDATVDAQGLAELLAQTKSPGVSIYAGVQEVLPGSVLRFSRKGLAQSRYWALEARPHTEDLPTTVARVRERLEEVVARQLVADVPRGMLLSGGLDSSVLTALAAKWVAANGEPPLQSFSLLLTSAEGFRADEMRGTSDAPFAHAMAEHAGTVHRQITLSTKELADPDVRRACIVAQDMPSMFGDMDASAFLLAKAVRERATMVLSGETADEVFGGFPWVHNEDVVYSDTFPWMGIMHVYDPAHPGLGLGLLDKGLLRKLDLRGYVAQRYREALSEVPVLEGETRHERRMREVIHLHLTRWLGVLLDRSDRLGMGPALEMRVPYCDHEFVQYVFNTPWSMKSHDGREKSLLRAAAKDLVPQKVLDRQKSPYPVTQDGAYLGELCRQLRDVLADPAAPVLPLIDVPAALAIAENPARVSEQPGVWAWICRLDVEMVLSLNMWLDEYSVTLDI